MEARKKINFPLLSVYWIPLLQLAITLLISALALMIDRLHAVSMLMGGLICVVGNAVFIWRFFRRGNSHSASDLLSDVYQSVVSKLLLTTLLFVLVFLAFEQLEILFLFVGFIVAQIVNWVSPLLMKRKIYK